MIFKFDRFIKENKEPEYETNSRAEILDMSWREALEKYAPWYDINCKLPLYRATEDNNEVKLISPQKFERYPKGNKHAIYQHFLNNQPGWGDRSKSVVMSTSNRGLFMYGNYIYRVIPIKENADVYMSTSKDLWRSFNTTEFDKYFVTECYGLLSVLTNRLQQSVFGRNGIDLEGVDMDKMKYYFDMVSENIKYKRLLIDQKPELDMKIENILKPARVDKFFDVYKGGIYEILSKVINYDNPKKDDDYPSLSFVKLEYDGSDEIEPSNIVRECWTESPCLLIKECLIYN
jgi:hypothetical protein